MSKIQSLLSYLEQMFARQINDHSILPASEGELLPFPEKLDPILGQVLQNQGIQSLYSHQVMAFESIADNRDTVIVSRTASGKTLSFLLPLLNEYLQNKTKFSVLLLYPTKALSRDQEGTLEALLEKAIQTRKIGTYDGDTPREKRALIQKQADFIISNPDMLHAGILPNHNRRWKSFLSRLRFIVIDEVHNYRGAFGSHVANVFRRLLRICRFHGSNPVFVCCSATIGNPSEHVRALFQRDFNVIQSDGAPKPKRHLFSINPPLVERDSNALYRKGTGSVSVPLLRFASKNKIRTICFCRARQQVERLYQRVTDGHRELKDSIKPYRGGLLPSERRALEKNLFQGKLNTIISTNALELGIDIGDLDFCILSGHPGTMASFWQQAGRVGRKGKEAVIVFIASTAPVDQYLVHHNEFVLQAPIEQAWLNIDNPYVIMQHLPCAAYEYPLSDDTREFDRQVYDHALEILKSNEIVVPYHNSYRYSQDDYPTRGVNIRGMTDYNVEIYYKTEVIGELDPIGARGTLYKDAIYQHLGTRYMSLELDLEKKLCRVDKINVDYYTEAIWENRLEMTEIDESKTLNQAKLNFGYLLVNKQPKMYKKIRERSFENIGYGPITLDAFEYNTTGFSLYPPLVWLDKMADTDKRFIQVAVYGLAYILKHTSPSLCMADAKDIDSDVALAPDETDQIMADEFYNSALYLYDTHEGGVGFAEKIYEKIQPALELCEVILNECECQAGCPSCIPPLPPGVNNQELEIWLIESNSALVCTQSLISILLHGKLVVPEIKTFHFKNTQNKKNFKEDEEQKKLKKRLHRAGEILAKKRLRTH